MKQMQINPKFINGLHAVNYNLQDAINEFLLLKLSSKIAEFNQECQFYEKKYNKSFYDFEKIISNRIEVENFEEYDDYMAWKFAFESKKYYFDTLKIIRSEEK